jgi:hypothetical protein
MMKGDKKNLVTYPWLRRGNYQLKISVFKNMGVLIVANHMMDVDKFFIKYFDNLNQAADFIEFTITKDYLNGGH